MYIKCLKTKPSKRTKDNSISLDKCRNKWNDTVLMIYEQQSHKTNHKPFWLSSTVHQQALDGTFVSHVVACSFCFLPVCNNMGNTKWLTSNSVNLVNTCFHLSIYSVQIRTNTIHVICMLTQIKPLNQVLTTCRSSLVFCFFVVFFFFGGGVVHWWTLCALSLSISLSLSLFHTQKYRVWKRE